jgi:hypothetical protein
MTLKTTFLITLIVVVIPSFAQLRKAKILEEEFLRGPGSVTLSDGSKISGMIAFNDNDAIVQVKNGEEVRTFSGKDIIAFDFMDQVNLEDRKFLVMEYADPETGQNEYSFFEILAEFEAFAILSKIDRVKAEPQRNVLGLPASPALVDKTNTTIITSQTETIFFLNSDGEFQPFVKIVAREFERVLIDSRQDKNYFINKKLFEQYTGIHYPALKKYIDENKLKLKIKEDFLQVVQEYKRLVGQ